MHFFADRDNSEIVCERMDREVVIAFILDPHDHLKAKFVEVFQEVFNKQALPKESGQSAPAFAKTGS